MWRGFPFQAASKACRRDSDRKRRAKRTYGALQLTKLVLVIIVPCGLFAYLVSQGGSVTWINVLTIARKGSPHVVSRTPKALANWLAAMDARLDKEFSESCKPCSPDRECPESVTGKSLEVFLKEQRQWNYSCQPYTRGRCCDRIRTASRERIRSGVARQLEPFLSEGIRRDQIEQAKLLVAKDDSSVVVQVLGGKIFLVTSPTSPINFFNMSCCSSLRDDIFRGHRLGRSYSSVDGLGDLQRDNPRCRLGLRHFLLQLQAFVNLGNNETPDFEIVYSPLSTATVPKSVMGPFRFPTWGALWRDNRQTITFPRHDGTKDVGLERWDEFVDIKQCADAHAGADQKAAWDGKTSQAVFRGSFITRSRSYKFSTTRLVNDDVKITKDNWSVVGRAALLFIQKKFIDLFDINYSDLPMGRMKKYSIGIEHLGKRPVDMTLDDQISKYNILLAAEGGDGWCEYLRYLLMSPSIVVKQETPYGEWFQKLLPSASMRPTDSDWKNVTAVVNATVENPQDSIRDSREAWSITADLVSIEGQSLFATLLFDGFSRLMNYNPQKIRGAREIVCNLDSGTCEW